MDNQLKPFVHLHNHTEFSLLDGIARIKKLAKTASERGWPAIAITDHGNMHGVLEFYKECLVNKVKPIVGCEFYTCDDLHSKSGKTDTYHLVLIAKNNEGYQNLLKLNSIASLEGFYYKPRIDYKVLKEYSKGLICLSACLAGHIPTLILRGQYEEAKNVALKLKAMFDEGDFYLEIQNHGIEEQKEVISKLSKLSEEINVKLVATNDVHYINKEDAEMQDVLMCVQMAKFVDEPDRLKFPTDEFYLKTYDEMAAAFNGFESALDTTLEIANKCDVIIKRRLHGELGLPEQYVLPPSKNFIPKYNPPDGIEPFEYLKKLTYDGLYKKYKEVTKEIIDRAESELTLIRDMGFVEYFLVVWDYINFARMSNIPVGPGRGSGVGSIVAYATSITLVDPLKYDLIFERFIHKERVSMPDFDVDFDYDRRYEVIEYVRRKYGSECVAMIATFGTMAAKNAIRDVARVLRMPYSDVDKLTKPIPAKLPAGLKSPPVLKYYFGTTGKEEDGKYIIPELKQLYDNDAFAKKIVDMAIKLEGAPRNTSIHAAGVVIAPDRVDSFVPLSKNGDEIATQYNMNELEQLGLLKMDFLGLRTLTDIDKAIKYIKKNRNVDIDFYNMEYDDKKVYDMIGNGETDAVFQLESAGMKRFMKELKPDCLEDIIAGVSLYRPGPMDSIPTYIKNKQNSGAIVFDPPILKEVLSVTYGCIVYQEQVMKVFQIMGGYNLAQADNVRRIMSKKKKEAMVKEKEKFINGYTDPSGKHDIPGALKLGFSKEIAERIFSEMETFASYAFNKSHAAAYAFLAYQTAYLKCYYEPEFLAAVLNNRLTNIDEIKKYVSHAKARNIKVLPPDINQSQIGFEVQDGCLRFGLAALKNVGVGVIEAIIKERDKTGKFKDFADFVKRVDSQALNKRCIESLILSGSFDAFQVNRSALMQVYEMVIERVSKDKKNKASGQFSLFDNDLMGNMSDVIEYPNIKEFNKDSKLKFEKEVTGVYISGHPLDEYLDKFEEFNFTSNMINEKDESEDEENDIEEKNEVQLENNMSVVCGGLINEIKVLHTKNGNKEMAFLKIEDIYGMFEVVLFPMIYARYKNILLEDAFVTIRGKITYKDGQRPSVSADNITLWNKKEEETIENNEKCLYLKFDIDNIAIYSAVDKILISYPGESQVVVKSTNSNKAFKLTNRSVKINNHLVNELCGVIDSNNIIVK